MLTLWTELRRAVSERRQIARFCGGRYRFSITWDLRQRHGI